jgi:hypothetical protein
MRPSVAYAARPPSAPAGEFLLTSVRRTPSPSASGAMGDSFATPVLTASNEYAGAPDELSVPVQDVDRGWTPVTCKTSRSHRERSNSGRRNHTNNKTADNLSSSDSESGDDSTLACTTHKLSQRELQDLMHRHEAIADQYCIKMVQKPAVEHGEYIPNLKDAIHENGASIIELPPILQPKPVVARKSQPVTVEEVDDEQDLISFNAIPGSSKGKGPDPRNWGGISTLQDFSQEEMDAQREALKNYKEIDCILKQEEKSIPTSFLVDFDPVQMSTPKAKKSSRKRLKSPGHSAKVIVLKPESSAAAAHPVPVPAAVAPAPVVAVSVLAVAVDASDTTVVGPSTLPAESSAARVQFVETEPQTSKDAPAASDRDVRTNSEES